MKLEEIKEAVDLFFEIDISSKDKSNKYVAGRAVYYNISKRETKKSYDNISKVVKKDHCAIVHAKKNFDNYLDMDNFSDNYDSILEYLGIENLRESTKEEIKKESHVLLSIVSDLDNLTDSDLITFRETRLEPFINMLKTRKCI